MRGVTRRLVTIMIDGEKKNKRKTERTKAEEETMPEKRLIRVCYGEGGNAKISNDNDK